MSSVKEMVEKLVYIERELLSGEYKLNKPILLLLAGELVLDMKKTTFYFEVERTSKFKTHFASYANTARRYKYKAITDLEELVSEFSKKVINENRCKQIVQNLIETTFYKANTKAKISAWKPKYSQRTRQENLNY
ncbi:hypothetical protein [Sutcliffiella deserti]|uniref:hypothetical protein n=1 Tax=Sutcliffiella deserti TaxID=2875501 RepID=UPI001CC0183D|nr:hypothetical protein [Sutcliffiella deserti]